MNSHRLLRGRLLFVLVFCVLATLPVRGQQVVLSKEGYLQPPKEIADAVLALENENHTLTNLSPDGRKFLITKNDGMPPLARMARPHVHLGEAAFDAAGHRSYPLWVRSQAGYELFFHADKRTVPVQVPDRARVSNPAWSPDGSKLAYYAHLEDGTYIYVADTDTGYSRRLTMTPVLATLVTSFQWSKDGKQIQTLLLPDEGKRELPKPNGVATEPKVRVARDGANPSRTYRFLLESPHDAKLLEHLATGQLALIGVDDGKVTKIGFPNMIRSVSMAPGEGQFRVTTLKKPFSYYVPMTRFGYQEGIWNADGKCLCTLMDRNIQENEPMPPAPTPTPTAVATAQPGTPGQGPGQGRFGGRGGRGPAAQPTTPAPTQPNPNPDPGPNPDPNPDPDRPRNFGQPADPEGKRDLAWRPDGVGMSYIRTEPTKKEPSGLTLVSLLTPALGQAPAIAAGAATRVKAEKTPAATPKEQIVQWLSPFGKDDVKIVYETPHRISGIQYSEDCRLVFLTQTVDNQRQITAVDLGDSNKTYVIYKSAARGGNEGERPAGPTGSRLNGGILANAATPDAAPVAEFARIPPGDSKSGILANAATQQAAPVAEFARIPPDDEQQRGFPGFGAGIAAQPSLMTRSNRGSVAAVRISSTGDVYISGSDRGRGEGVEQRLGKPYIDKVNIKTGKKTRIFEGKGDMNETIDAVDGDDIKLIFTTRQKQDVVPDSYVTELATGKQTKLTNNVNPAPWFQQLKVERIQVTRVDGIKFWVKVTTPPKATGKLPAMFWIYPREYTDQAAYNASRARGTQDSTRFSLPNPRSMTLLCLLGYAVVEPDVPIVGPAGRMNDNYVPDLRNSLWAVIDELDKRGLIDRDRLACGGHSYGAFSTANAMAHTPFFKAGIAGDGNYNRTLTTMSFQTERRQLWDARETYLEMSPLLWANRVNGALLMYHGMDDANVGTNPINADYMFMALDGLGKPAALYMYPYEGHGPLARETTLDLWARWVAWLDLHVKKPKVEKKEEATAKTSADGP